MVCGALSQPESCCAGETSAQLANPPQNEELQCTADPNDYAHFTPLIF
jgi:hypothetical protein